VFIGHYAVAMAAKRVAPRTSLGTFVAAATLADLLLPVFFLAGWEHAHIVPSPNPFLRLWLDSTPISHSLVTLMGWGVLFAVLYRMRTGYEREAVALALLVVSHWVLDWVTHRADMPLYPGGTPLGLGLWNSPTATVVTESVMFAAALWLYATSTRARDGVGRYGFWAFVVVLLLSYYASLFSPPPSSERAFAIAGFIFGWLFVGWAGWADKHRDYVAGLSATG
jgi:membrane-bound metal-dependent hydrolase YbcI (DUF457 family)